MHITLLNKNRIYKIFRVSLTVCFISSLEKKSPQGKYKKKGSVLTTGIIISIDFPPFYHFIWTFYSDSNHLLFLLTFINQLLDFNANTMDRRVVLNLLIVHLNMTNQPLLYIIQI